MKMDIIYFAAIITLATKLCKADITFSLKSTLDTVTLTWTKENGHGYTDFTIALNGVQQGDVHPGTEFDEGSTKTSETFTGLTSGTQYTVAINSGGSEIYSGTVYTLPAPVATFTHSTPSFTTVTLSWTHTTGEKVSFTIRGGEGGEITDIPSTDTSREIIGLTPGQSYTFRIVAVISANKESAENSVHVTTPSLPVVSDLAVESVTETSVTCTWTAVTTDEDVKYKLSRRLTGESSSITATLDKDKTSHEFTGSTPGETYDFSIVVAFEGHEGTPDEITDNTQPAAPTSVTVQPESTTEVKVSWTPDARFTYSVSYKKKDSDGASTITECVTSGCFIDVSSAGNPGTDVTVSVTATLGKWTSDPGTSDGYTKPPPPGKIIVQSRDTASLTITWEEAAASKFEKYTVTAENTDGNTIEGVSAVEVSAGSPRTAIMSSLVPGRVYRLNVVTVKGRTDSDVSTGLFRTNPETIKPNSLELDIRETDSLTVSWEKPETGDFTKYIVGLAGVANSEATDNSAPHTFSGLVAGTVYTVQVRVQSGEDGDIATETTAAKTVSEITSLEIVTKPRHPAVENPIATLDTISVTWAAPEGDLTGYKITLYDEGGSTAMSGEKIVLKYAEKTVDFISIDGVEPGTIYIVKIVSYVTHKGEDIVSDQVNRQITTVPKAPSNLATSSVTTSGVVVSWTKPSQTAAVSGYDVQLVFGIDIKEYDGASSSRQFSGLRAGASYSIVVKAYKNSHNSGTELYSEPLEGSVTLIPKRPDSVQVPEVNIGQTRLGVTWSAPSDSEYSGFMVHWRKNTETNDDLQSSEVIPVSETYKYYISNLVQGETYHIEVKTKSGNQFSSASSTIATTKPSGHGLNIMTMTTNTLTVTWPSLFTNYSSFRLQISSEDHIGFTTMSESVAKDEPYEVTFYNLRPGRTYYLILFVVTDSSTTPYTDLTTITMPSAILDLLATTIDMYNIQLSWRVDADSKQDMFMIQFINSDDYASSEIKEVKHTDGKLFYEEIIGNIRPGYHVNFTVIARREYVDSNPMETRQNTVPAAVINLAVQNKAQTSVRLSWDTEDFTNQDVFMVNYRGTATSVTWSSIQVTEETLVLDYLLPGDKYTFEVTARTGPQDSEVVAANVVLVPNAPTLVWDRSLTDTESVTFTWNYVTNSEYHAEQFELELRLKDSADIIRGPVRLPATVSSYRFDGLTPSTTYTAQIVTLTFGSVRSDPNSADGKCVGTIGAVQNLQVTDLCSDVVTLEWTTVWNVDEGYFSYRIYFTGMHNNQTHNGEITLEDAGNTYSIVHLRAQYTYTFTVIPFIEEDEGFADSVTQLLPRHSPTIIGSSDNTVTINVCNGFSLRDTETLSYSLFVLTTPSPSQDELNELKTWSEVQNLDPQPPYVAIHLCSKFFSQGDKCGILFRNRRQSAQNSINIVVGSDVGCLADRYCNGPLQPSTDYYFMVRAFSDNGSFTDSDVSLLALTDAATEEPEHEKTTEPPGGDSTNIFIGVGVAVGLLIIVIAAISVVMVKRRRQSQAASKDKAQDVYQPHVVSDSESVTDYNEIDLYNELEIPQYEMLTDKDEDKAAYDKLQVSSFTNPGAVVYDNMSGGQYCNTTDVSSEREKTNTVVEDSYIPII